MNVLAQEVGCWVGLPGRKLESSGDERTENGVEVEKSKDIKHPRDVGNAREAILGRFLDSSGYLPKKYSVSNTSVRVASTEGFISREIDILLFDAETSVVLM